MRYSTWIILLPLYIAGFFVADLIQYLVNVVAGNEGVMFVTTKLMDIISKLLREVGPDQNRLTHARLLYYYGLTLSMHWVVHSSAHTSLRGC